MAAALTLVVIGGSSGIALEHLHTGMQFAEGKVWPPEWRAEAPAPDGGARLPAAGSLMGRRQSGRRDMEAS